MQTTIYGLILGLGLVGAGVFLVLNKQEALGGLLITAGLGAVGLGVKSTDSSKSGPTALLLAAGLLCAVPVKAQTPAVALTDVAERTHVTVNGGSMYMTTGQDWSGASLGGTVLYDLHPKFSVFAGYDHGFPMNDVDKHLNLYRAVGSIRVHDYAFVGFGYAWFDQGIEGALTQLIVTKSIARRLKLGGVYAHVFASDDLNDFEYAKVYLNYHLLGKE